MTQTAVITGVGPGLGTALARKFAQEGCRVGLLARSPETIDRLAEELGAGAGHALAVAADVTQPGAVTRAFQKIRDRLGPVDLLVHHAGSAVWKELPDLSAEDFRSSWETCALGAFLCCREAVPDMLARGGGGILFTGATSSLRGRAGASAFASAKFAVRGFAESLARELWPKNIHVAHVVIDGVIDTPGVREHDPGAAQGPLLDPDAIASTYWDLARQDRGAWSLEIDVRPFDEEFFT